MVAVTAVIAPPVEAGTVGRASAAPARAAATRRRRSAANAGSGASGRTGWRSTSSGSSGPSGPSGSVIASLALVIAIGRPEGAAGPGPAASRSRAGCDPTPRPPRPPADRRDSAGSAPPGAGRPANRGRPWPAGCRARRPTGRRRRRTSCSTRRSRRSSLAWARQWSTSLLRATRDQPGHREAGDRRPPDGVDRGRESLGGEILGHARRCRSGAAGSRRPAGGRGRTSPGAPVPDPGPAGADSDAVISCGSSFAEPGLRHRRTDLEATIVAASRAARMSPMTRVGARGPDGDEDGGHGHRNGNRSHRAGPLLPEVHGPQAQQVDGDGDGDGRRSLDRGQLGVIGDLVEHDLEPGADGGRTGEHDEVAVAPDERLTPVASANTSRGPLGDRPRPAGRSTATTWRTRSAVRRPRSDTMLGVEPAGVDRIAHPGRGGQHRLAEHDDREQPVALGDVARVPGRGRRRSAQTGTASSAAASSRKVGSRQPSGTASRATQPTCTIGDAGGVPQVRRATGRVVGRRPQPLGDHGQPHDHVAEDRDRRLPLGRTARGCRRRARARRRSGRTPRAGSGTSSLS